MLTYNVEINYYAILEMEYTATSDEIKKNYRKLALKHHPDRGGDQEKFKELANAYELLMDEETRGLYDFERRNHTTEAGFNDTTEQDVHAAFSGSNPIPPVPQNSVIFNTVNSSTAFSSTSLVPSSGMKNMASEGIKAEEMSEQELYHLARSSEPVALAVAKNIHLLEKLYCSILNIQLGDLAKKHPSFAYHILAGTKTRQYLCAGLSSYKVTTLLKNDYHLLLLIVGSTELTEKFLYKDGKPVLNGTQLHEIYNFHMDNRGGCSAFMALLESNPQFNVLFQNQHQLQSENAQYELHQLEQLDDNELFILAQKHLSVAAMIMENETLLKKFSLYLAQGKIVDILLAYPDALMDDFFNHPRSFYFDKWAKTDVLSACKQNIKFFLHILNSQESNWLNGYEIENLIENNSETQQHIYQFEEFKNRHKTYKTLVKQITTRLVLDDEIFSEKVRGIYQPIFENMGTFGKHELLNVTRHLAKSHDHQILATNCALIRDTYNWDDRFNCFAEISSEFFCVTYDHESLRNDLYDDSERLCHKYFAAFERLLQDSKALPHISDEALYKLQQKWVGIEGNKVKDIFNKNQRLMERWYKGYKINKLHQGAMVSDYQQQQSLQNEPESIIQIRSLISDLQDKLAFDRIIFEGDQTFIARLAEQVSLLSTTSSLNTIDERILPGIFWFLVLTNNPNLLNEGLPLDFIHTQMEMTINDLKRGNTIDESWLIKCQKNLNGETIHKLYSAYEQEQRWLNMVPTGTSTETFDVLKRAIESGLNTASDTNESPGEFGDEAEASDSLMASLARMEASLDRMEASVDRCVEASASFKASLSTDSDALGKLESSLSTEHDKTRDVLNVSITSAGFTLGCYCSSIGVCMASIAYELYKNRVVNNDTEGNLDIYAGAMAFGGALSITGGLLLANSFFSRQTESNPNNPPENNEQQRLGGASVDSRA